MRGMIVSHSRKLSQILSASRCLAIPFSKTVVPLKSSSSLPLFCITTVNDAL
jgi:hypothetical protein